MIFSVNTPATFHGLRRYRNHFFRLEIGSVFRVFTESFRGIVPTEDLILSQARPLPLNSNSFVRRHGTEMFNQLSALLLLLLFVFFFLTRLFGEPVIYKPVRESIKNTTVKRGEKKKKSEVPKTARQIAATRYHTICLPRFHLSPLPGRKKNQDPTARTGRRPKISVPILHQNIATRSFFSVFSIVSFLSFSSGGFGLDDTETPDAGTGSRIASTHPASRTRSYSRSWPVGAADRETKVGRYINRCINR